MSRSSKASIAAAVAVLLVIGVAVVITEATGSPSPKGLRELTRRPLVPSIVTSTTTSTLAPVPAALLRPPTPANDPALDSLLGRCASSLATACYAPGQIQAAFGLLPLYRSGITGSGVTIGIVDSFGSPTIRQDLAHFDAIFGLPPPPRFDILQVAGRVPPFNPRLKDRVGWAAETTLDVEWAHALAPGAAITLALTPVDETEGVTGFPQMVTSEEYMIRHHLADVISQSFAATEETFPNRAAIVGLRGAVLAAEKAGVTMVAASGDAGPTGFELNQSTLYPRRVAQWPASDPLVTSVGGLALDLGPAGQLLAPPSAWNDSTLSHQASAGGGGLSAVFARPAFQNTVAGVVGSHRGVPDISMQAAQSTPAAIYATFPGALLPGGIGSADGTSLASPQFAAIVALADQLAGHSLGWIDPALYRLASQHAPGIVDVVSGDTTVPVAGAPGGSVAGYRAGPGYDLATGLGTVNAADLVPELAGRALPKRRT